MALYLASYIALRVTRTERWERDGHEYVIVPASAVWLYYLYRPLSYIDGAATGMRFHIGPHQ